MNTVWGKNVHVWCAVIADPCNQHTTMGEKYTFFILQITQVDTRWATVVWPLAGIEVGMLSFSARKCQYVIKYIPKQKSNLRKNIAVNSSCMVAEKWIFWFRMKMSSLLTRNSSEDAKKIGGRGGGANLNYATSFQKLQGFHVYCNNSVTPVPVPASLASLTWVPLCHAWQSWCALFFLAVASFLASLPGAAL